MWVITVGSCLPGICLRRKFQVPAHKQDATSWKKSLKTLTLCRKWLREDRKALFSYYKFHTIYYKGTLGLMLVLLSAGLLNKRNNTLKSVNSKACVLHRERISCLFAGLAWSPQKRYLFSVRLFLCSAAPHELCCSCLWLGEQSCGSSPTAPPQPISTALHGQHFVSFPCACQPSVSKPGSSSGPCKGDILSRHVLTHFWPRFG